MELLDIHKSFGGHTVLRGLNLSLRQGDFVIILGANGSGKSTLLRILAGLTRPDKGSLGERISPHEIGHAGHALFLYPDLSVAENLELFSILAGAVCDLETHLDRWNLKEVRTKKIAELSKGQQARVSLARAFVHSPRYLFLDEPTSALDENSLQILVREIARTTRDESGVARGFVVIATHDISRLANFATRILVLQNGKIFKDSAAATEAANVTVRAELISVYLESNR